MASQVQKYFTRRLEEVNLLNVNMLDLNYFSMFDAPTGFIFYLEEIRGITNRRPTEVFQALANICPPGSNYRGE